MKDQCCNHDCNQGRNCPVREGTHKPAEAVHKIHEPTVNHQLTIEREAFEAAIIDEQSILLGSGANKGYLASVWLVRDGDTYRQPTVRTAWAIWKQARAALSATPTDHVADAGKMVLPEPDAAIKDVMELIDALQFENVGIVKAVTPYELNTAHRNAQKARAAIESKLRALLATGGQAQAEHIKALIEVSRMPNQEHVADAHNAAVRHLRAIAAAKEQE